MTCLIDWSMGTPLKLLHRVFLCLGFLFLWVSKCLGCEGWLQFSSSFQEYPGPRIVRACEYYTWTLLMVSDIKPFNFISLVTWKGNLKVTDPWNLQMCLWVKLVRRQHNVLDPWESSCLPPLWNGANATNKQISRSCGEWLTWETLHQCSNLSIVPQ
jgi:hypothetical protein